MKRFALLLAASLVCASGFAKDDGKDELAACRADMERHCIGIAAGEGRQMQCMYELRDKLAPACATLVTEKYRRYLAQKKAKESR